MARRKTIIPESVRIDMLEALQGVGEIEAYEIIFEEEEWEWLDRKPTLMEREAAWVIIQENLDWYEGDE